MFLTTKAKDYINSIPLGQEFTRKEVQDFIHSGSSELGSLFSNLKRDEYLASVGTGNDTRYLRLKPMPKGREVRRATEPKTTEIVERANNKKFNALLMQF